MLVKIGMLAVKYGIRMALIIASTSLLITIRLPIIYEMLNLSLILFLGRYLIALVFLVPCLSQLIEQTQDASEKNFKKLKDFARRLATVILIRLILYLLVVSLAVKGI